MAKRKRNPKLGGKELLIGAGLLGGLYYLSKRNSAPSSGSQPQVSQADIYAAQSPYSGVLEAGSSSTAASGGKR